jgi:hypothetical protein
MIPKSFLSTPTWWALSTLTLVMNDAFAAEPVSDREYRAAAAVFQPAPWADGEEMRLDLKFSTGVKIASAYYSVSSGETNGTKIWRLASRIFGASQSLSHVEVDVETFRPLHSRWKHNLFGEADAQYTPGDAEVLVKGKDKPKKIALGGVVYDNEEAIQLLRRLPLATGYKTTLRFLSSLSAGSIVPVQVTVSGPEKINVSAGSFDCYKVALSIRQTFWYSTDAHRYLVKFEAGGAVGELTEVAHPKPGQPEKFQDPELGFSLAVPFDWRLSPRPDEKKDPATLVDILDPDMAATIYLKVRKLDSVDPAARKSVRGWAESEVADFAKAWKNFKVRPDSWNNKMIAGREGVTFVGDYVDAQTNKVAYAAFAFGAMNAAEIIMLTTREDLESLRPKFNTILDGYQTK